MKAKAPTAKTKATTTSKKATTTGKKATTTKKKAPATKQRAKATWQPPPMVYQLKVTLQWSQPPIWRRLLVPAMYSLGDLHYIIQDALGWTNSHLHEFAIGQQCYALQVSPLGDELDESSEDADAVTLAKVLAQQVKRFGYTYDFGDSWDHVIEVEALLPAEPDQRYPQCTGGARSAPPEDCGGMPGYDEFIKAYTNPKHRDHEELHEWAGDDFDAERFDLKAINKQLRALFTKR